MKKLIYICIVTAGIFSMVSCTKDFADTNTDKNVPTAVTPDLLLSGVIRSLTSQNVSNAWGIGNLVAQYNAKIQFVTKTGISGTSKMVSGTMSTETTETFRTLPSLCQLIPTTVTWV